MFVFKQHTVSLLITTFLLLAHNPIQPSLLHNNSESKAALNELFGLLDVDGDGQIEAQEAFTFLGNSALGKSQEFDTNAERTVAYQRMIASIDGSDSGETISENELEVHLGNLFSNYRVVDWLKHGLGHEQHAVTFEKNAISPLDFPLLVKNNGGMLQEELGIESQLHRTQILRAIQRQILGMGEVPSPPQNLTCICHKGNLLTVDKQNDLLYQDDQENLQEQQMVLVWQEPENLGHPQLHKYIVEAQCSNGPPVWQELEESEGKKTFVHVNVPPTHSCRFRVFAWNSYGRSNASEIIQGQFDDECYNGRYQPDPSHIPQQNNTLKPLQWFYSLLSSILLLIPVLMRFINFNFVFKFLQSGYCWMKNKKITNQNQRQQQQQQYKLQQINFHNVQQCSSNVNTTSRVSMQIQRPAKSDFRHVRSNSSPSLAEKNVQEIRQAQEAFSNRSVSEAHLQLNSYSNIVDKYSKQIQFMQQPIQEDRNQSEGVNKQKQIRRMFSIKERDSCSFGMCDVSWKRWYLRKDHLKALLKSHYCGICQNHYCKRHTRISPHGSSGRCGQDSACICVGCFNDLSPAVQRKLDAVNKLQVRKVSFKSSERTTSTSDMECEHNFECCSARMNFDQESQSQNQTPSSSSSQLQTLDHQFKPQNQSQNVNLVNGVQQQQQDNMRSGSGRQARKNWDKLARKIWSIRKWYGAASKRKNQSTLQINESAQDKSVQN